MTEEERKEKVLARIVAWRKANPEKVKVAQAAYRANNREKVKATNATYRKTNREKNNAATAKWRAENPDKAKEYFSTWYKANSDKVKINKAFYVKNRRITDPIYAMSCRLRSRLALAFKANGYKKQSTTEKMLGCSFAKFKRHIESQFTKGMNWDNRADWHLDHILPLSCAKTIEGLEKLSHYSNIRPLWAKDNLVKSDNLVLSDY